MATTYCDRALASSPNDVQAETLKARILFEQGNVQTALKYIEKILGKEPMNRNALELKATCLFVMNDINSLSNLVPITCEAEGAFASLELAAISHLKLNEYEVALSEIQRAQAFAHNAVEKSRAHLLQARILLRLHRYNEASENADKDLALGLDKGRAFLYRGEAKLALGNLNGALDDATCALRYYPYFGRIYKLRAEAFRQNGQINAANVARRLADYYASPPAANL